MYNHEEHKLFIFSQLRDYLIEAKEKIEGLTIKDVQNPHELGKFLERVSSAIENYKEKAPEEFKREFKFDINKLEKEVQYLQNGFLKK